MTDRLYYHDSFLHEFEGGGAQKWFLRRKSMGAIGVYLDRTAFYPTSGGQVYDTGWLSHGGREFREAARGRGRRDRRWPGRPLFSRPTGRRSGARVFAA